MEFILVDEQGKEQFYSILEKLKNDNLENANVLSKSYTDYVGDGWHDNPIYEEAMRKNRMIDESINKMLQQEKLLKIVSDKYNDKCVNINDIVEVEFIYSDDDKEIEKLKLTGKFIPDTDLEIKEVTLNSPVGKAIYKKKIGECSAYTVLDREVKIRIIGRG